MSYQDYESWWMEYRSDGAPQEKDLRIAVTREPLVELQPRDPVSSRFSPVGKPEGFWYSFGTEWLDWCIEEGGVGFLGNYVYSIEVDSTKLLRLSTLAELYDFSKRYSTSIYDLLSLSSRKDEDDGFCRVIDWAQVAQTCGGVEVFPYLWEARLDPKTFWYYSWDVASGCIWDPSVLVDFKLLVECPVPHPKRRNENGVNEIHEQCGS